MAQITHTWNPAQTMSNVSAPSIEIGYADIARHLAGGRENVLAALDRWQKAQPGAQREQAYWDLVALVGVPDYVTANVSLGIVYAGDNLDAAIQAGHRKHGYELQFAVFAWPSGEVVAESTKFGHVEPARKLEG